MSDGSSAALGKAIAALGEQLDTHLYFLAITVALLEQRDPDIRQDLIDILDEMLRGPSPPPENEVRLQAVRRLRQILEEPEPQIFH